MAARITTQELSLEVDDALAGDARADLTRWLRAQEKKDLVRFVTIGSVDDGKSTLIGRLLHDAHGLYQDQLDAVRTASARGATRGAQSSSEIDFSLFTDGLVAEREQGITIDVAYRYFATDKRKFVIADTPGHVQYTRNMATGASTADVALILVDARLGVLPQTRRHAHIAALLGIPHVVTCVNKMDLVGFDQTKFDAIDAELAELARGVGLQGLFAIPISALAGDNVVTPSSRMPWWSGGTVLGHLEDVPVATDARPESFRFPVQMVLRPHLDYRGFAGQIASGAITTGDEVVLLPSGRRTRVAGVDEGGRDVGSAQAPLSVVLRLADDVDVSRGDMIARAGDAPTVASDLEADLVWMSERPLDSGRTYVLRHTTRTVRAQIEVLHGSDPHTLAPAPAETLGLNDIGRVRVRCRAPIFFDAYRANRRTGAFIVIDSVTNDTVAAGMIAGVANADPNANARSQVSDVERRARLGHGGLVSIEARTVDEGRELAYVVERELFDRGVVAVVIDVAALSADAARAAVAACERAGLCTLVVTPARAERGVARIGDQAFTGDSFDAIARSVASSLGG